MLAIAHIPFAKSKTVFALVKEVKQTLVFVHLLVSCLKPAPHALNVIRVLNCDVDVVFAPPDNIAVEQGLKQRRGDDLIAGIKTLAFKLVVRS